MLVNRRGFRIFNEYDLDATIRGHISKINNDIRERAQLIQAENEEEFIGEQFNLYKIHPIDLDIPNLKLTISEQLIPSEYFPSNFWVDKGEKYSKRVITFHLPFKGDETLLHSVPSTRILITQEVSVENGEIIFDVIDFNDDPEIIRKEKDNVLQFLSKQASYVNKQVEQCNSNLRGLIKYAFDQGHAKLSNDSELIKKLGVPVKSEIFNSSVMSKKDNIRDKKI